jgi:uncharacterized protein YndB with AHSA1/START domain
MPPMTLTLQGETQVVVTRRFAAPPARLWAAHTDPALMQRWLTGPDGWVMSECQCDARPGGTMRCVWEPEGGGEGGFYLTAEFLAVEPISRMVHVERMFLPDPTPDNHVETRFAADGTGTLLTLVMTLPDAATREAMLATGMEEGMEASYARFERMEAIAA